MPPWPEVFLVFCVSHLVGDFLIQTDYQATHKYHGLSEASPPATRALLTHVLTYTLAFVPALIWLADDIGAGVIWVAAYIYVTHAVIDDARIVERYMRCAKGPESLDSFAVRLLVDQSLHLLTLFALALLVTA